MPVPPRSLMPESRAVCRGVRAGRARYDLCWFKTVTQSGWDAAAQSKKSPTHSLGSKWSWDPGPELKGTFEGGANCFNGPARSTKVTFVCGDPVAGEEITRIQEDEKCIYGLTFVTAAAC
eukprot:m.76633 g.76633  ORF g.76633 m.76633 type:complete len:120 (-) comp19046_c0_seq6:1422-1781(-)